MFRIPRVAALVGSLGLLAGSVARAQGIPELPQPSPLVRVEQRVGVTDFAIEYSSPGVKGRPIWDTLVPYGKLWRTGANAATKLSASRDFRFGDVAVPAGTYSLFTIPGADSWTVVLNSQSELSGTRGHDPANDVASIQIKPEAVPHRERLTFIFSNTEDAATRLDFEWEKVRIAIPIAVDSKAHALANIDKSLGDAWRPHFASARWLLDNGGDLDTALGYVDTSIAIRETWWNHWVRAQILGKQGKPAEARQAAETASRLGQSDEIFTEFFAPAVNKAIAGWK